MRHDNFVLFDDKKKKRGKLFERKDEDDEIAKRVTENRAKTTRSLKLEKKNHNNN